jgi:hypothetical protein
LWKVSPHLERYDLTNEIIRLNVSFTLLFQFMDDAEVLN